METTELIEQLRREGESLASAADKAGADTPVPTCPDWTVTDLLRHTGMVHRWASRYVAERLPDFVPGFESSLVGPELNAWFRAGHQDLVRVLSEADPDVACWTFLPAPSPLAFWARRQAHETAVHRADAESALGGGRSAIGTRFAADGIDELLAGFHARQMSRVRTDTPRTLRVRPSDTTAMWTVRLSPEPPHAVRTDGPEGPGEPDPVDCELQGSAEELYLLLWNRLSPGDVTVLGDPSLARLWQHRSAVTWG